MQALFPGEMKLFHIFHDSNQEGSEIESNRLSDSHRKNVWDFLSKKLYPNAKIIAHQETSTENTALPSYRLAAEIAMEEQADFHLWIEDDALVFDTECNLWPERVKDIGLYRFTQKQEMVNPSFLLSTPGYNRRLLELFKNYRKEDSSLYAIYGSQIERVFWQAVQHSVVLPKKFANRHHPYPSKWAVWRPELEQWLQQRIPEISTAHLGLLKLDFEK